MMSERIEQPKSLLCDFIIKASKSGVVSFRQGKQDFLVQVKIQTKDGPEIIETIVDPSTLYTKMGELALTTALSSAIERANKGLTVVD
jgi:hypothetical protein